MNLRHILLLYVYLLFFLAMSCIYVFYVTFYGGRNRIRTCDFYRVNYEMFMFLISLSLQTRIVMGFLFFALVNAYLFLAFFGYTLWAILWAIHFTNY